MSKRNPNDAKGYTPIPLDDDAPFGVDLSDEMVAETVRADDALHKANCIAHRGMRALWDLRDLRELEDNEGSRMSLEESSFWHQELNEAEERLYAAMMEYRRAMRGVVSSASEAQTEGE